ncbi:MAG: EAL domain-containing protein [Christensenellales bacterium]
MPAIICILAYGIPSGLNAKPFNLIQTQFGWVNIAVNNFWDYFFYAYYIGYTAFGLVTLLKWGKKSSDRNVKMQSRSIFWSFLFTLTLASFTDVLLIDIPQVAPIIFLIPIAVIYRTIIRYGFISSNPASKRKSFLPIVVIVILYVFLSFLQIRLTVSGGLSSLGFVEGNTLLGLITQLQMFLSIYLTIKEDKAGLIASVLMNSATLLSSLGSAIQSNSLKPLPGTISHLVTFMIIALIARYKKKTAENIQEINKQRSILEESEKKLYQMAYFDSLTGLYNKDMTFPIDLLKIDMDFVRGITSPSKKERAIIKSIIQLAKNLTIEVLAEGVETIEQYTYLKDNGCNKIQGYYFYKPMPANEIENLLSN